MRFIFLKPSTHWLLVAVIGLALSGCVPVQKEIPSPESESPGTVAPAVVDRGKTFADVAELVRSSEFAKAEQINASLLIASPDSIEGRMLAADILAGRGKYRDAAETIDGLIESLGDERQVQAAIQSASWLIQAREYADAEQRLKTTLARQPLAHDARGLLASLLNRMGRRHEASSHLIFLCRLGLLNEWELRSLLVVGESYAKWLEVGQVRPSSIAVIGSVNLARQAWSAGHRRDALKFLQQEIATVNQFAETRAFHGRLLMELQETVAANRWWAESDESLHRFSDFWVAMGIRQTEMGERLVAVRCFAEAIRRDPTDVAAIGLYARALEACGQSDVAARAEAVGQTILESGQSGVLFSKREETRHADIENVVNALIQLQRPYEALMWLQVAAMNEPGSQEMVGTLAGRRMQLQRQKRGARAEASTHALAGLPLVAYPLPELSTAPESLQKSDGGAEPFPIALQARFFNVAPDVGIDHTYVNALQCVEKHLLIFQQLGAGVACADFDRDGHVDLYFGQGAGDPPNVFGRLPNAMLRNLGDRFVNITIAAMTDDRGYTTGVTTGDWNQDGLADLVVGNLGVNQLLLNQGDGTFRPAITDPLWNQQAFTASVAMADLDGDAIPDLFEVNYQDDPKIFDPIEFKEDGFPLSDPGPLKFRAAFDRIFLGSVTGVMQGRTLDDGGAQPSTGLGIVITDIDGQSGNEAFVANDMLANHYWQAEQGGFTDRARVNGIAFNPLGEANACMGIAAADFDLDGLLDFHVTNLDSDSVNLFKQRSPGQFADIAAQSKLDVASWEMVGFGTQAIDYDNNSSVDLIVGNGNIDDLRDRGKGFKMPTQFFSLSEGRFELQQVVDESGYLGQDHLTRAVATLDWNADGRMDFVASDLLGPAALLENRTPDSHHWLQLVLVGTKSERDAIGARVKVTAGGRTLFQSVNAGDGYMCKNEAVLHFGLANAENVSRVEVVWPSGHQQTFSDHGTNQRVLIVEGSDDWFPL